MQVAIERLRFRRVELARRYSGSIDSGRDLRSLVRLHAQNANPVSWNSDKSSAGSASRKASWEYHIKAAKRFRQDARISGGRESVIADQAKEKS